jgi:MoaA/NifB/PqqE/SkfB family radical SAM enzyme
MMVDLSWLLEKLFELHGAIPRLLSNGRAFLPIHVLIEVTYRCNLRCNFCQYLDIIEGKAKPPGPAQRDLGLADITRYIDELPRHRLISFAGGETLVRKDFPEILRHAARHHRAHIITNGSLITEDVARDYVDLAPRRLWQNGLVLVEVSLEGDRAQLHDRVVQREGSWQRAIDGIRHMVRLRSAANKRYPKLDLKLVVTADTVGAMVDFMRLARSLGVDLVNFLAEHDLMGNAEGGRLQHLQRQQRTPRGVDPEFLRRQLIRCHELARDSGLQIRLTPRVPIDEFARHYSDDRSLQPSEYACEGPWSRLGITADGRIGPMCPYGCGDDMRQQTIRGFWNGERMRAFRRATRRAGVYAGCHGCCNLKYIGSKHHGLRGVVEDVRVAPNRPATSPALPDLVSNRGTENAPHTF